MALENENGTGMVMPVTPMGYGAGFGGGYGYPYAVPVMGGYGSGFGGGFGGDWGSLIVLFLFAAMFGGFGNGFGGFGGGGYDFPWLLAGQAGINSNTNAGFNNAAVNSQLAAIQSSLDSAEVANCNRAMNAMQTAYSNEIADLNRSFAAQTAVDGRLDSISSALAKCCCDNELRTEQLRYTVATENAADREALSNGLRDIIANATANTQSILDKLCQQELDAERRENAELRSRINMLDLAQSQATQTAQLRAGQIAEVDALYDRLRSCPVPTMPVYGMQPVFTCGGNNFGCGCGGNGSF